MDNPTGNRQMDGADASGAEENETKQQRMQQLFVQRPQHRGGQGEQVVGIMEHRLSIARSSMQSTSLIFKQCSNPVQMIIVALQSRQERLTTSLGRLKCPRSES
eukprot:8222314-Pyramimonas_sp.AAC.1